jgi:hypothetical protein
MTSKAHSKPIAVDLVAMFRARLISRLRLYFSSSGVQSQGTSRTIVAANI